MQAMPSMLDAGARGVYPIAATPFTESGDIDWPSMEPMIEFYLGCKVQGLTILGLMGEAQKLSDSEAAELTRVALRLVAGRVPVVVGVSSPGTANLLALSRVAMNAGASGVMIAPLNGLKTEAQIAAYFADVIAALGPDVPVCYQDYPQSSQSDISAAGFVRLVDAHDSIVMFKHEDCPGLKKLSAVRKACDGTAHRRVAIFVGNGGLYVPQELLRGADGIMTGFAYPDVLVEIYDLFAVGRGDDAEDLYDRYLPLLRHEQQPGFGLPVRKEILRRRGAIRCAAVRAPGGRLDAEDIAELDRLMRRLEAKTTPRGADLRQSRATA
jgi:4-hydroxy-tetrahydrodipicolinate synthase